MLFTVLLLNHVSCTSGDDHGGHSCASTLWWTQRVKFPYPKFEEVYQDVLDARSRAKYGTDTLEEILLKSMEKDRHREVGRKDA